MSPSGLKLGLMGTLRYMGAPAEQAAFRDAGDGRGIVAVIGALMLGLLLAALDQTIVSTALPTIVGEFGGLAHLSWVVTAYLLASTVSMPLWGKAGDLYGRKRLFQAAPVVFVVSLAPIPRFFLAVARPS